MNDLKREKEIGIDFDYLDDVLEKKKQVGDKYQTPGFGLAAQLFCSIAKFLVDEIGEERAEKLLRKAVEYFGKERGKRIAERVKSARAQLTFKNWLIYTDIDSVNFRPVPSVKEGDFIAKVKHCSFFNAAKEWGLERYAKYYCNYVDYKILEGYNPNIKLVLDNRFETGKRRCTFRYIMKDSNK
ncbi:MAG: hypothetical protein GF353_21575 [Candidatus Lokiarchaeota archaeon]|nr:hypothetical protein [Candidatus Lokiarchaeota archaeon]